MAAGAWDAYLAPVYKKKNRPAVLLSVLYPSDNRDAIMATIFRESTTLGVRWHPVFKERRAAVMRTVATPWGAVRVKIGTAPADRLITPEFEDCHRIAEQSFVALKSVYLAAISAAWELESESRPPSSSSRPSQSEER